MEELRRNVRLGADGQPDDVMALRRNFLSPRLKIQAKYRRRVVIEVSLLS
jgi:hypothetical protein